MKLSLTRLALLASICLSPLTQAQDHTFSWFDFGNLISDVQPGDSFTANNVGGSGVDFTFTFTEQIDSRNTDSSFSTILNADNPGDLGSFPQFNTYTGNGDFEGLYNSSPLYLASKTNWDDDALILTITMSAAIVIENLIIGDLDRITNAGGTSANFQESFEDKITVTSSLLGSAVNTSITTTSSNLSIVGNTVEAIAGGPGDSTLPATQVEVDTLGAVDTLTIVYQNGDGTGLGLADTSDGGWSNSHWITLGTDDQLLQFSAIPEPSSTALLGLGGLGLLLRRKR